MSIDLTKYEGHTPAAVWARSVDEKHIAALVNFGPRGVEEDWCWLLTGPDRALLRNAPALLEEVNRLRADLAEAVGALSGLMCQEREHMRGDDDEDITPETRQALAVLAKHNKA